MEPVILALENKYAGKVDFIIVDTTVEANYPLIDQYMLKNKINSIPAYFFLGNNGDIKDGYVGELTQAELEVKMNNLLKVK